MVVYVFADRTFLYCVSFFVIQLAVMASAIGVYVAYGFASLGAILVLVGIVLTVSKSWRSNAHTRFENDTDDELQR